MQSRPGADPAPGSPLVESRYVQPRAVYIRKRTVELTLLGMLLAGGAGAVVSSVLWLGSDPTVSRWNWVLPVIAVAVVLEVLLVEGRELVRHRFMVDEDGFTPPFFRPFGPRKTGETAVPFTAVDRITATTYGRAGTTHLYGLTIALSDGRRMFVRESDVGEEGISRLSAALSASLSARSSADQSERERHATRTARSAVRREMLPAIGLLVVLALSMIALFAASNPNSYAGWALATIAALGTVFALGWIRAIRRGLSAVPISPGGRSP